MLDNEENSRQENYSDISVADELNKMQIEQLHKATLNFSNNSLETKKLCITVEIAVITAVIGISKNLKFENLTGVIKIFAIVVPLLFYLVDIVFYFYQDRLREKMLQEENEIRCRHSLPRRPLRPNSRLLRFGRSVINKSQIMYWCLILLAFIIPHIISGVI